jgi:5-methylcytosine-specific restriction endonuclease McrA
MKKVRTKALEIPTKVKMAVAERDSFDGHPCCLWCGKPAPTTNPLAFSNAHYIPRSQGGLGIEQNTLTLCWECHLEFDNSENREVMKGVLRGHLKSKHPDWDEENLIYKKGF